mmetsp:Transcript_43819/g.80015  ORF Transcript_43819/g.80015 Transcript_43819/m.80015 type:complete len:397 (-) Transcript_43819:164-1354(-)
MMGLKRCLFVGVLSFLLSEVCGKAAYQRNRGQPLETVADPLTGQVVVVPRKPWWRRALRKKSIKRLQAIVDPVMNYMEIIPITSADFLENLQEGVRQCTVRIKSVRSLAKQAAACTRQLGEKFVEVCFRRVLHRAKRQLARGPAAAATALLGVTTGSLFGATGRIIKGFLGLPRSVVSVLSRGASGLTPLVAFGEGCVKHAYAAVVSELRAFNGLPAATKLVLWGAVVEVAAAGYLVSHTPAMPSNADLVENETATGLEEEPKRKPTASVERGQVAQLLYTQCRARWPYAAALAGGVAMLVAMGEVRQRRTRREDADVDEESDFEHADGKMKRMITPPTKWLMEDVSNLGRPLTPRSQWYLSGEPEPPRKHQEFRIDTGLLPEISGALAAPELRGA